MKQDLNQKGIVLSGLIYALLIFYLLLLASLLTILWYRQSAINKLKEQAEDIYEKNGLLAFNTIKGVNRPALATGMIPVKWVTDHWVTTTESDDDWYQYGTTTETRNWANVIQVSNPESYTEYGTTVDVVNDVVAFWVWIPRYVYKISSGWHGQGLDEGEAGVINIQFSIGIDDTIGGTVALDTGTGAEASNNKWTNHPAFTFGDVELTGLWVAKFEASGTAGAIDSKPNVTALSNLKVGEIFTATRNMETNSRYGWGTSGAGIDTHLIKNTEWGAAAYLAQSTYGKNAEIWINNSSTYTTGCAGDNVSDGFYAGCENAYNTSNGQQASTTGNVYGIYDMSGGSSEYTSSYLDNNHANLVNNGASLLSADNKYKDVYSAGAPENSGNNYTLSINHKGDAIYETSSFNWDPNSWYSDYSYMPTGQFAWFLRSGAYGHGNWAGAFHFYFSEGTSGNGFRPVLGVSNDENIDRTNTIPVITLVGDSTVEITQGTSYTDAGATASDVEDGDLSSNIVITGTVNVNVEGIYYIYYNVTDSDGNAAAQVTRTVYVVGSFTAINKTFGGTNYDDLGTIIETSDGGYLLVGGAMSNDGDVTDGNNGSADCWIVKIDNTGAKQWDKTYGGSNVESCNSVIQTSDGGYLLGGSTYSSNGDVTDGNNGNYDYWVIKINNTGTKEWDKTYGGSGEDSFSTMIETSDGGYLIGGISKSSDGDVTDGNNGGFDYWIVKINNSGTKQWNKTFGGSNSEYLYSMVETSDGGYLLGGFTQSNDGDITDGNSGVVDYWIVKTNSTGTKVWDKTYGGSESDTLSSIVETSDGGYLLGGSTYSSNGDVTTVNKGRNDYWIVKIDSMGTKEWDKTYGGSGLDYFNTMIGTSDGGYLLGGYVYSNDGDVTDGNNGESDYWVVKIDSMGTKQWNKTYGGNMSDLLHIMIETTDGYLLGGSTLSNDGDIGDSLNGPQDYWILKIRKSGLLN